MYCIFHFSFAQQHGPRLPARSRARTNVRHPGDVGPEQGLCPAAGDRDPAPGQRRDSDRARTMAMGPRSGATTGPGPVVHGRQDRPRQGVPARKKETEEAMAAGRERRFVPVTLRVQSVSVSVSSVSCRSQSPSVQSHVKSVRWSQQRMEETGTDTGCLPQTVLLSSACDVLSRLYGLCQRENIHRLSATIIFRDRCY